MEKLKRKTVKRGSLEKVDEDEGERRRRRRGSKQSTLSVSPSAM